MQDEALYTKTTHRVPIDKNHTIDLKHAESLLSLNI